VRRGQQGFSLIELMISMTLGLVLTGAIAAVYLSTNRSSRQNDLIVGMQDQGRFALSNLSRDLTMAGYMGGIRYADVITPNLMDLDGGNDITSATNALPVSQDCGPDASRSWAFNLPLRAEFRNQSETASPSSRWRCLNDELIQPGTDILVIRRVSGAASAQMGADAADVTLRPHEFYLQTNGVAGTLIRWGAAATAAPSSLDSPALPPMRFHRFLPRLYFVRSYTKTPGDGRPALCRKELCHTGFSGTSGSETASCGASDAAASATGLYTECIAEGVEDLQISWGLDTDGDEVPDRYSSTPGDELQTRAVTAQIALLVRSRDGDATYTNQNSYQIGDKGEPFVPSEVVDPQGTAEVDKARHYYRRIYSTTVKLRNGGA